ncbi:MAG: imidazoleglycerol-phosphate dehydratase HisB [Calditrichaeota bacterium]|nr:imidazoleglycerol-phosphate dehydratase HisB [Calditrichota bacterium]MCB0303260.1 imidazoleglycerol-phosphate dehydratase HisB [Calditrichota bacterium]MCB0316201.1 imidazoleglycerol-phosphate dehydratase HisB [Calditrichota bacterium]MCB9089853.1 imidazoleglycerol-phosphate dehydratase HisB [Calditrichia bacterium]
MRSASISRETRETRIAMSVNLDGRGESEIVSPIGFLTHMLETFARHGIFDLQANIEGDLEVDQHHTVEDCGIVLGEVFKKALGDKRGIKRAGFFIYPMDEALATVAIDISGRSFLKLEAEFSNARVGELEIELLEDFFLGFSGALGANLHIRVHYGRSDHHKIEAVFKALAKAMKSACEIEPRIAGTIPSTKGVL